MTATVLIADGEPVLREGLAELLASQADFIVVGEASTTSDAIAKARACRPDIALLSHNLALGGGLEAAARIREISPSTRLIVMVPPRYCAASHLPADALLSYGARADQLIAGIRAVPLRAPAFRAGPSRAVTATRAPLTPREEQVCALLARAYSNRQIQQELGIHNSAVKRHVHRILLKLGAHNRIEVAIQLARSGASVREGGP